MPRGNPSMSRIFRSRAPFATACPRSSPALCRSLARPGTTGLWSSSGPCRRKRRADVMRVKLWGVRGSIPVPGQDAAGYGGNTSCVGITTDDGTELILDAGSGIRELGVAISGRCRHVHVLLTHLHLDHIQGLTFFAPIFDPEVEVTVWGPPALGRSLRERLARFISNPIFPVEIRDLPARVHFEDVPGGPWRIGGVEVKAAQVAHRGLTLGYRLTAEGDSVCYLPDHEPGLGQDLTSSEPEW